MLHVHVWVFWWVLIFSRFECLSLCCSATNWWTIQGARRLCLTVDGIGSSKPVTPKGIKRIYKMNGSVSRLFFTSSGFLIMDFVFLLILLFVLQMFNICWKNNFLLKNSCRFRQDPHCPTYLDKKCGAVLRFSRISCLKIYISFYCTKKNRIPIHNWSCFVLYADLKWLFESLRSFACGQPCFFLSVLWPDTEREKKSPKISWLWKCAFCQQNTSVSTAPDHMGVFTCENPSQREQECLNH